MKHGRMASVVLTAISCLTGATAISADTNVFRDLIAENVLRQNAMATLRSAESLSPERRFEVLRRWVLPNERRVLYRFNGCFVSGDNVAETQIGQLVSPVLELIHIAKQQQKLDDLTAEVERILPTTAQCERQRAAMLFLLSMARGGQQTTTSLETFVDIASKADKAPIEERWPMLLVLSQAVTVPEFNFLTMELILNFEGGKWPGYGLSQRGIFVEHVRWFDGLREFCATHSGRATDFTNVPSLENWLQTCLHSAGSAGSGRPGMHWQPLHDGIKKLAGHNVDYLIYRMPLRGDYQVECDISTGSWINGQLMVAGTYLQANGNGSGITVGDFQEQQLAFEFDRPLSPAKRWTHYRAVVRGDVLTIYLNGRKVHAKSLPANYSPWIGIHSWHTSRCEIRNLRITGSPTVPDSVDLIADENLNGWAPYFVDDSIGTSWELTDMENGGVLASERRPELAGTVAERILKYQRPMVEDGVIEYEFFHQKDVLEVHPALGRLCFLLSPDGIRHHWHTDGVADRTERHQDNGLRRPQSSELTHAKNTEPIAALRNNAWNRIKLQLDGDFVRLSLNGELVDERELANSNDRTFGLFHFADRTSARIRNIIWNGDWPRTVPPVEEQQLRSRAFDEVNLQRSRLPVEFQYNFADGLASDAVELFGEESATLQLDDGIQLRTVGWRVGVDKVGLTFGVQGDFDIEVKFRDLMTKYDAGKKAGFGIRIYFQGPMKDFYAAYRRVQNPGGHERAAFAHREHKPDGKSWFRTDSVAEESTSGRLRIIRHGTTITALFAEEDSPNFRLIDRREVTDAATRQDGLELLMWCQGKGSSQVVLQNVRLHAERWVGMPAPEVPQTTDLDGPAFPNDKQN